MIFFPCYRRIEHTTKLTRRRHLESIDGDTKLCLTSRKGSDQFDFSSGMATVRNNNKKLTVSANYAFNNTYSNNQQPQFSQGVFSFIHRFETAMGLSNSRRCDSLQTKTLEFLVRLHEYPQTIVPIKLVLYLFQAKALSPLSTESKKIIGSLCRLFGLSLSSNDNRRTLVAYEDLPTVLKHFCNEHALYAYLLQGLRRKVKFDSRELDKLLDKEDPPRAFELRTEDLSLLTHMLGFVKNSLKHLKSLIGVLQQDENLAELAQTLTRSAENQEKRVSLLPAAHKSSFFTDSLDEGRDDGKEVNTIDSIITPDFLKVTNQKHFAVSIEDIPEKISATERKITPFPLSGLLEQKIEEETRNSPLITEEGKESPTTSTNIPIAEPLLKIYNISPTRAPSNNAMKNSMLKNRTPNLHPGSTKKRVNLGLGSEQLDATTQQLCKQKIIELLLKENAVNEINPGVLRALLKNLNEILGEDEFLSLPNFALASQAFEAIMFQLLCNKTLLTRKLAESLFMSVVEILQTQMELSVQLSSENLNVSANYINFLGFCLCEVLGNELSVDNEANFIAFQKHAKLLLDAYPIDKFFDVLKVALEKLGEKLDESNLLDNCKTIKKTYHFVFGKLTSFGIPSGFSVSWFATNLLSLLRKFFYFNKTLKDPKTPSSFTSFFNKIGFGGAGNTNKSPMVKSELYERMNKKDRSVVNDFKGEMQGLLRNFILFELNRCLEGFEETGEDDLLVSRLKHYSEAEQIIFDEEFDNSDFFLCLLCLFGQMIERYNKELVCVFKGGGGFKLILIGFF